jgi:RNA polymerase sigma-70 factor (ECF subfamily)
MDRELVLRAQEGDEEAFAVLALECGDRLHAVAQRILRDTDLAEDATQQAIVNIWRELPELRDPARFDAWSFRILVNACYTEGRGGRARLPKQSQLPAVEPRTGDAAASIVNRDLLERAFRRLTIEHRVVVVLFHYLDLPAESIAETLGIPIGTVRSRLHHAMRALRAAIEADARPVVREAAR